MARPDTLDDLASIPWVEHIWVERGSSWSFGSISDSGRIVTGPQLGTCGRLHVRQMDEARSHLELVFHRFLAGETWSAKDQHRSEQSVR